jgi:hypothetical protein
MDVELPPIQLPESRRGDNMAVEGEKTGKIYSLISTKSYFSF